MVNPTPMVDLILMVDPMPMMDPMPSVDPIHMVVILSLIVRNPNTNIYCHTGAFEESSNYGITIRPKGSAIAPCERF